ncbi:MAG: hypothetical protein K2N51_05420 [Lachnospiraceae bacterium]|nr:hypothetical protein [Lachnospiraceae bacterium]
MESLYAEVVVKPKQSLSKKVIVAIVVIFLAFVTISAVWVAFLMQSLFVVSCCAPMVIAIGAITWYFYKSSKIEYEYIYCDDTIDIARIRAKEKRKNILKVEVENIELFAPADAKEMEQYNSLSAVDYASAKKENPIYAMVTVVKGKKARVLLEPSKKMLDGLSIKLGRKLIRG